MVAGFADSGIDSCLLLLYRMSCAVRSMAVGEESFSDFFLSGIRRVLPVAAWSDNCSAIPPASFAADCSNGGHRLHLLLQEIEAEYSITCPAERDPARRKNIQYPSE